MKKLVLSAFALLAACGPMVGANPGLQMTLGLASGTEETPGAGIGAAMNRSFVESQPNEMILASVLNRSATAFLVKGGENGARTTWLSPDGISLTYDNGILVSSRGLGSDLMGVDVKATRSIFQAGAEYERSHEILNGLDQIELRNFSCSMEQLEDEPIEILEYFYHTQRFEEICYGETHAFRNLYWRDRNGVIWQSRQWVSAEVGYVGYQKL